MRASPKGAPSSRGRKVELRLVRDRQHYDEVVRAVLSARVSIWISTANVKDLHVEAEVGTRERARGRYVSLVSRLASLARAGVEVRVLHAGVPSGPFRASLTGAGATAGRGRLSMRRCPRVHLKMIAVDGAMLYLGSANLTGAGLGAKGDGKRNFEAGIVTDDDHLLDAMQATFERIWTGGECKACALRGECPLPLERLEGAPPGRPAFSRAKGAGDLPLPAGRLSPKKGA